MQQCIRFGLLLVFCLFLLAGCAHPPPDSTTKPETISTGGAPFDDTATFIGTLPCDDCLRVDISLNIRTDGLYQLRKTYVHDTREPNVYSQMGTYRYVPESDLIILGKEIGLLKTYVIEDPSRLRFVEWQGAERSSQIQYYLSRTTHVDPFDDIVKMRGLFGLKEGKPIFQECSSQLFFNLSTGGDYSLTLQNYFNTPHDMNRSILISIMGRISSGTGEEIVIDQFRKIYPHSDCEGNRIATSLTGTHWQLFEIKGQQWSALTDQMAHLLLKEDRTIEGITGCNKITGTYLIKSDVLLIKRGLSSRTACPDGMEGENLLVSVLDSVEAYRIEKNVLELIDQNDQVLARFLAGP